MTTATQTLLLNATLIPMRNQTEILYGESLLIEDDKIVAVGCGAAQRAGARAEVIDMSGKLVLPGLVNTHVHTSQQLARGLADDVDLLTWLRERTWPYENALTAEDAYVSCMACCIELIRSGVTTFAEAGGWYVDSMGEAVTALGLRAALCASIMDVENALPRGWSASVDTLMGRQLDSHARWQGKADGRIRHWLGLRTIFNCSDALIVRTKQEADRLGTSIHMHVAEIPEENEHARLRSGKSSVGHLEALGLLDKNLLAVHAVWMTPRDIDAFARRGVKVSHCPAAAMHVLGFALIPEMQERGICVSLGTDGAPCNNRMDLMDEMYLAALIHKGRRLDPRVVPAGSVLKMATLDGARAMNWDDEIGSLEVGKKADLIVVNPRHVSSLPVHDPISAMVYAMHSHNVESSMCNGRWLMRERKILSVNEEAVLDQIQSQAQAIRKRAGIHVHRQPAERA